MRLFVRRALECALSGIVLLMSHVTLAQTALTVEVIQPEMRVLTQKIHANGLLKPKETAVVNARINGATLERIEVDLGDYVRQGQLLARYDDALIQQELRQAKAQVAQADAGLQLARRNASRARKLLTSKAISRLEGDQMMTSATSSAAQLNAAQAAMAMQELRLSYITVRSPVDGIISAKQAILGSTSNVGQPLFTLIVDGVLSWHANVPQTHIERINVGSSAQVTLDDGTQITGKVDNIAPTIEPNSREIQVQVTMDAHPKLRSGMLVRGLFITGSAKRMLIPASSTQRDDGHVYVWQVGNDSVVHRVHIETGERLNDLVEVLSGLQLSDRIVLRGGAFLAEGDKVKVVSKPTSAMLEDNVDDQAPSIDTSTNKQNGSSDVLSTQTQASSHDAHIHIIPIPKNKLAGQASADSILATTSESNEDRLFSRFGITHSALMVLPGVTS